MGESPVCFAVDQMVVKLGKYIRILGYDAVFWKGSHVRNTRTKLGLGEETTGS